MRNTRQRKSIRTVLSDNHRPMTPNEVLVKAADMVPGLGIATVYRCLRDLSQEGEVITVEIPGMPPRYEMAHRGHHHHFQCRGCERLFDISGCPGDLSNLAPPGFELDDHSVTLFGRCASCVATDA